MGGPGSDDGALGRPLPQPDRRSCGAASLVAAAMLHDPAYAASTAEPRAFRAEVLSLHRRLTSPVDARGRLQVPWPRALGTPPWAVARHLAALTRSTYRVRWARSRRDAAYDRLASATPRRPVVLYVGSRWLPRHVVLVLARDGGALRCYEPSSGRVVEVDRTAFVSARLGLAGWDRPWFTVAPSAMA